MTAAPFLVWFRRDLRIEDNPALAAAMATGRPAAAIYILDEERRFAPGSAQRWFIHHALGSLRESLLRIGVPLRIRTGAEAAIIEETVAETGAGAVFWNRRYAADEIAADASIKASLKTRGVEAHSFNGSLLREPFDLRTKTGGPYRVFTPFWKALQVMGPGRAELPAPAARAAPVQGFAADDPSILALLPKKPDWAWGFRDRWKPGEDGAHDALQRFLSKPASSYGADRDRPGLEGTSRLSPHLAVGTISPLSVWNAASRAAAAGAVPESQILKFLSEIAWREFAYHLLFYNPDIDTAPIRSTFAAFPWREDEAGFSAWKKGQTGVPIVDAGMRELWRTGWMHNRVRMITASFLVKNLLIDWRKGERWFRDTLVDADPANNAASWQWVAGCGADAAPYFRIFNPVTQGEKFDPDGDYVRRFVPEAAEAPRAFIHCPWKAPENQGRRSYPAPIVDLDLTRKRALSVYDAVKSQSPDLEIAQEQA